MPTQILKSLLLIALCSICFSLQGQPPEPLTVDFDENGIDTSESSSLRPEAFTRYLDTIVTIFADGELGQGVRVRPNLVLTSYELVAGNGRVEYFDTASERPKTFLGYVAFERLSGLVLLKTSSVAEKYLSPFHFVGGSCYNGVYVAEKVGDRLVVDKLEILPRERKIPRDDPASVRYPYPAAHRNGKRLHGYLTYDSGLSLMGLTVCRNGRNEVVSERAIDQLVMHRDLVARHLSDLPGPDAPVVSKKRKPSLYEIGISSDVIINKKLDQRITLDYIKRTQRDVDFYVTYEPVNVFRSRKFDPNLQLIDLETGEVLYPVNDSFKNDTVFNGTSHRAKVSFEGVSETSGRFMLYNIPIKQFKYIDTSKNIDKYDSHLRFFDDIIINNFPVVKKASYHIDAETSDLGTVAFFVQEDSNVSSVVTIHVEGKEVGKLTSFMKSNLDTDVFCGMKGTITLQLKAGEYRYTATQSGMKIQGRILIAAGKCLSKRIAF